MEKMYEEQKRVAFITGITGQDGSYLSELLLEKGYHVYGIIRRTSLIRTTRIDHLSGHSRFHTIYGDLVDTTGLLMTLNRIGDMHPDCERLEVYNLGAQSHVKVSFEIPDYTAQVDGLGVLHLLEAVRMCRLSGVARFYQASTSEMYGKVQEVPQTEQTPFYPRSPYGVAKLYGYWIVKNYRESFGMYACNGILFNHESKRRGETFITRKVTIGIGKILRGELDVLCVGNLDALRDWGHAKDYVRGMWMMMQMDTPDDYVLATGQMTSVRDFITRSFAIVNIQLIWSGSGVDEIGCGPDGRVYVKVDSKYFRPCEVEQLCGDASKARNSFGWEPHISIDSMISEMVQFDTSDKTID